MNCNPVLGVRSVDGASTRSSRWGVDSEHGRLRDVLLGPPETFRWMDDNLLYSSVCRATERAGMVFDRQIAMRQHREMADAYEDAGVRVHWLDRNESTPYQVYARDSSFMTPWGAVIAQLANPRRRGEYASCIRFYASRGVPVYDMVSAGNFEGGDFMLIEPGCALIGYTGLRGEEVAAKEVGGWLEGEGWEVRYAGIDGFFVHIDLMVCVLAERAIAVCLDTCDPGLVSWIRAKGFEVVPVGYRETMDLGCNVMALGEDRILSTAGAKDLNAKLRALGFRVYDPDMSMYTSAGGGVHCLAQPLRRDPA